MLILNLTVSIFPTSHHIDIAYPFLYLRVALFPGRGGGNSLGGSNGHTAANGTVILQAPLVLIGAGHSLRCMCVLYVVEGTVAAVWHSVKTTCK